MPDTNFFNQKTIDIRDPLLYNYKALEKGQINIAGWSSLVARWAHNPEVVGSNPSPATIWFRGVAVITSACHAEDREFDSRRNRHFFGSIAQSVEQRTENPCVAGSIPAGATILLNL